MPYTSDTNDFPHVMQINLPDRKEVADPWQVVNCSKDNSQLSYVFDVNNCSLCDNLIRIILNKQLLVKKNRMAGVEAHSSFILI